MKYSLGLALFGHRVWVLGSALSIPPSQTPVMHPLVFRRPLRAPRIYNPLAFVAELGGGKALFMCAHPPSGRREQRARAGPASPGGRCRSAVQRRHCRLCEGTPVAPDKGNVNGGRGNNGVISAQGFQHGQAQAMQPSTVPRAGRDSDGFHLVQQGLSMMRPKLRL